MPTPWKGRAGRCIAAAVVAVGTFVSCSLPGRAGLGSPGLYETHELYLTVFLIDGLANEVFRSELELGALPNLGSLIAQGAYVERGITSFPSVSGFAHYPFLTGEIATESGVFGLRWFDRSRESGNFRNYIGRTVDRLNEDLSPDAPTLFESVAPDRSVTYNSVITRGVTEKSMLALDLFVSKYRGDSAAAWLANGAVQVFNAVPKFGFAPDVASNPEDLERRIMEDARFGIVRGDRVQFIVLMSLDNMNHLQGYRTDDEASAAYVRQLRLLDGLIGDYRRESIEQGTEDRRLYLVASDHGITEVSENISIGEQLKDSLGLAYDRDTALRRSSEFDKPLSDYVDARTDMVQALQGNSMSYLYFKKPHTEGLEAWHRSPTVDELRAYPVRDGTGTADLIETIASIEGVDLVIHRGSDPGSLVVRSVAGAGEITPVGPATYTYRVLRGVDPLRYDEAIRDRAMHEDEWLARTAAGAYPYTVPLLGRLMSTHRGVDVIVTTRDGYDHGLDFEFLVGNYSGGHGGLGERHMVVPFILAGPGIRPGTVLHTARAEDVGSTLQYLMGTPPRHPERVLRSILR